MNQNNLSFEFKLFIIILTVTSIIKIWLANSIPITGDEAYFYLWGKNVDWGGFYDHPPMIGWILWLIQKVSSNILILRIPAIILWIVIAFGIMNLIKIFHKNSKEKSWLIGSLFLILPFTWSLNLITTDIPLIFFTFLSGYCFIRGEHSEKTYWFILCGIFLGLSLLSKYLAGLLVISYAIYYIQNKKNLKKIFIIFIIATPFILINMVWNSNNCWSNIIFNLINRNQEANFSLIYPIYYFILLLYLITPWASWFLIKQKNGKVIFK